MIFKKLYFFIFIVLLLSCNQDKKKEFIEINGTTMGTNYNVKLSYEENLDIELISQQIENILNDFNNVCSTYLKKSEISKINHLEVFEGKVSPEFKFLFEEDMMRFFIFHVLFHSVVQ